MDESGPPPRVLYIDDDPGIARLVQRGLQRIGFTVATAGDADAGEAMARAGGYDCIALDHYMPGRDGLDLLASLITEGDVPPVIFVTGAEEPRIAVTALKSGAADYVVKDVRGEFIELLGASIRQEITRARLQRERDDAAREVRESRDRLQLLAVQQQILLREVNHRVANSLQLISSLIQLQARRVQDSAARDVLRQAAERVEAVTLVHKRLYTGDDVETVEMDGYLAGLAEELSRVAGGEHGPRIELDAAPVRVVTDKAVPIGLIVNELVTNAIKYAYPSGVPGTVRVRLHRTEAEQVRLVVEDDGVGYPAEPASPSGSGLGTLIVNSMLQSLDAEMVLDRGHRGTRFVVQIPA